MADGLIKKIFSFGSRKAQPEPPAPAAAAPAAAAEPAQPAAAEAAPETAPEAAPQTLAQPAAAAETATAELTPFEAWQAEQRAKAARKEQAKQERVREQQAKKANRSIDQAGLLLRGGEEAAPAEAVAEPAAAEPKSWLARLKSGMAQSSRRLNQSLSSAFTGRKLDDTMLEELEDALLAADLGLETSLKITEALRAGRFGRNIDADEVRALMADEIAKVLEPCAKPLELDLSHKPHVILVVGVNGTGKTTTIGKLAAKMRAGGLSVMLAAGDTFRAAAIEQLHIWGKRTGAEVVSSKLGGDAAGLAYDAYKKAKEAGADVLLIDTAGRLQNKTELMDELAKIVRVLKKLDPAAPHTVLQNLDATTGQNALNQVEIFGKVANVSGLVMTKLDGTARGGILVAIAAKYKLPIYFIGVGEDIADLEPFSAHDFAAAIAGE